MIINCPALASLSSRRWPWTQPYASVKPLWSKIGLSIVITYCLHPMITWYLTWALPLQTRNRWSMKDSTRSSILSTIRILILRNHLVEWYRSPAAVAKVPLETRTNRPSTTPYHRPVLTSRACKWLKMSDSNTMIWRKNSVCNINSRLAMSVT